MGTQEALHTLGHRAQALLERFLSVREKTESLCLPLKAEDFMLSVTEDTSPPKWHLAHTTWFFEHFILENYLNDYQCFSSEFNFLFNSYYKRVGEYLPKNKRAFVTRPTVEDVFAYRRMVTKQISTLLQTENGELLKLVEIGINHEEQHQELLLMDIKRNFFENPLRPHYQNISSPHVQHDQPEWITFHSGLVNIGIPHEYQDFTYDNEKDQHRVWVESFQLSSHLVTNEEFLSFIEEGGYEDPLLWLSDGWDFKQKENWNAPLYWEKKDSEWWTMTFSGMEPLDLSAPVMHVSFYEAAAFAKWRGVRLPTEAEWETASRLEPINGHFLDSSEEDFQIFSQIHGTVWEWTSSAYNAYPRFKALEFGMNEYNEKFMCNQFVLRGGCALTPKKHYRLTYRNFYYPHMRWMYAGIRLAKDVL